MGLLLKWLIGLLQGWLAFAFWGRSARFPDGMVLVKVESALPAVIDICFFGAAPAPAPLLCRDRELGEMIQIVRF